MPPSLVGSFARLLRERLEEEFPGEVFRTYPDFDGTNVMIVVPPKSPSPQPLQAGRAVAFERRVRTIVNRLLSSEEWQAQPVDH